MTHTSLCQRKLRQGSFCFSFIFQKVIVCMAYLATTATGQSLPYSPIPATSTDLVKLGDPSFSEFINGAPFLAPIGDAVVPGVTLTRFADPIWDGQLKGSPNYWMGLAQGGCGYNNLLDPTKYPYLMGISLTGTVRSLLGFTEDQGVGCGACIEVTCTDTFMQNPGPPHCPHVGATVVAMVVDVCPEQSGHFDGKVCMAMQADMYINAWMQVAGGSTGPEVSLRRVMCPDPQTNVWMMVLSNRGPGLHFKAVFQNVARFGVLIDVSMTCFDGGVTQTLQMVSHYGAVWEIANQPTTATGDCYFTLAQEDGLRLDTKASPPFQQGDNENYPFVQFVDLGVQFVDWPGSTVHDLPAPAMSTTSAQTDSSQLPCTDVPADALYTCGQQASWGTCEASWMWPQINPLCPPEGCCAFSCKRCSTLSRRMLYARNATSSI